MNLPSEQINPSQQAERTMPFVLMIARQSHVDAGLGRQIGRGRCNGLDSWFEVIDRYVGADARVALGSTYSFLGAWLDGLEPREALHEALADAGDLADPRLRRGGRVGTVVAGCIIT